MSTLATRCCAALALALLCGSGCKKEQADVEAPPEPKPVTVEEAEATLKKLEKPLGQRCDPKVYDAVFDRDALAQLAVSKVDATPAQRRSMLSGMLENFPLGQRVCEGLDESSSLELLRARKKGRKVHALYRSAGEGGINYLDLHIGKNADGQVRIFDFHNFMAGDLMSETLRRILQAFVNKKAMATRRTANLMNTVRRHLAGKQYKAALDAFRELPGPLRKEKALMLLAIQITFGLDEEIYAQKIEAYEKAFPGDPSLPLVTVDGYFLRKKYDKALAAIDKLDEAIGGDPYLHHLRANMYVAKRDVAKAVEHAGKAVKGVPHLSDPYWSKLDAVVMAKRYGEAVEVLTTLRDKFDQSVDPGQLAQDEDYGPFFASEEYKAFAASKKP